MSLDSSAAIAVAGGDIEDHALGAAGGGAGAAAGSDAAGVCAMLPAAAKTRVAHANIALIIVLLPGVAFAGGLSPRGGTFFKNSHPSCITHIIPAQKLDEITIGRTSDGVGVPRHCRRSLRRRRRRIGHGCCTHQYAGQQPMPWVRWPESDPRRSAPKSRPLSAQS